MFKFSKIVNFHLSKTGLTSKWGRISPELQWKRDIKSIYIHKVVLSRTFSIFVKSNPKGSNVYIIAALCHIKAALSYLNAALMQH